MKTELRLVANNMGRANPGAEIHVRCYCGSEIVWTAPATPLVDRKVEDWCREHQPHEDAAWAERHPQ